MRAYNCIPLVTVLCFSVGAFAGEVDPACTTLSGGALALPADIASAGTINCTGMVFSDFGYEPGSTTGQATLQSVNVTSFGKTFMSDLSFYANSPDVAFGYLVGGSTGAYQVVIDSTMRSYYDDDITAVEVTACLASTSATLPTFAACEAASGLLGIVGGNSGAGYLQPPLPDQSNQFPVADFWLITQFDLTSPLPKGGAELDEQLFVPEPSSIALIGSGLLLGLLSRIRRRRRS